MIRCLTCGRSGFDRLRQPHRCNHGYRKRGFIMIDTEKPPTPKASADGKPKETK